MPIVDDDAPLVMFAIRGPKEAVKQARENIATICRANGTQNHSGETKKLPVDRVRPEDEWMRSWRVDSVNADRLEALIAEVKSEISGLGLTVYQPTRDELRGIVRGIMPCDIA